MKKAVILILIISSTVMFAQRNKGHHSPDQDAKEFYASLSPEELATLKTKHLMLRLHLNDAQYNDVYELTVNKIKDDRTKREQQKPETNGEITTEERYERLNEMLDEQLAFSKHMQSILNQEQFEKWQHINKRRSANKKRKHRRSP